MLIHPCSIPLRSLSVVLALKTTKDADVKRLRDLFNSSPSEDNDSPDDNLDDKRELLP